MNYILTASVGATLLSFALPAFALTAPPASALTSTLVDDGSCIIGGISQDSFSAISDEVLATEQKANPAFDRAMDAVAEAAVACMKGDGWSKNRLEAAMGYAVSGIAFVAAGRRATEAGLDTKTISEWFDNQDETFRTTFATDRMPKKRAESETARMIEELAMSDLADGVDSGDKPTALGAYVGTLVLMERLRLGLQL
jgi:hypothetical protein